MHHCIWPLFLTIVLITSLAAQHHEDRARLLEVQAGIQEQAGKNRKRTNTRDKLYSSVYETNSQTLLSAHYLFETGVTHYLKKEHDKAFAIWKESRELLQTIGEEGAFYLRRVNAALMIAWMQGLPERDLAQYRKDLATLAAIVDANPLPQHAEDYGHQLRFELQLQAAHELMELFGTLHQTDDASSIQEATISAADRLWKRKTLLQTLAPPLEGNTLPSHEALIDRLLFEDIPNLPHLSNKLQTVWSNLNDIPYTASTPLFALYLSETHQEPALAALFQKQINSDRLQPQLYGDILAQLLKHSERYTQSRIGPLLDQIAPTSPSLHWTHYTHGLILAEHLGKHGHPEHGHRLLLTIGQLMPGDQNYNHYLLSRTKLNYQNNAHQDTVHFLSRQTIENPPAELYYWRGLTYAKLRQPQQAIADLQRFLNDIPFHPEAPDASYFLSSLIFAAGDEDKARQQLAQTIASYPDTTAARKSRALLSFLFERAETATARPAPPASNTPPTSSPSVQRAASADTPASPASLPRPPVAINPTR